MKKISLPYKLLARTKDSAELVSEILKKAGFNVEKHYSKTYDEKTKNMIYQQEN